MVTYGQMAKLTYAELKPKVVALDIDGVLADTHAGVKAWLKQRGFTVAWVNPPGWGFETWGIPDQALPELVNEFLFDDELFGTLPLIDGAKEAFDFFRARNARLVAISSRVPNLMNTTLTWLAHHEMPFDMVTFTNDKRGRVEELGVDVMLEDSPYHLELLAPVIPRLYRPEYPYNKTAPGTPYTHLSNVLEMEAEHWPSQILV